MLVKNLREISETLMRPYAHVRSCEHGGVSEMFVWRMRHLRACVISCMHLSSLQRRTVLIKESPASLDLCLESLASAWHSVCIIVHKLQVPFQPS